MKKSLILIAIFVFSYCNAQTSDFIVTKSFDTIYVGKITLTDDKVITKTNGKKEKYAVDEIVGFYDVEQNSHFERVKNPSIDKIKAKQADRYDYRELERSHVDDYEKKCSVQIF